MSTTFENPFPPPIWLMGENQGSPSNQLGIKIVSPTVFTQALVETEGYPNGYCGLPSVSTRSVELALNVGYERICFFEIRVDF